jgi:hypothetical protein
VAFHGLATNRDRDLRSQAAEFVRCLGVNCAAASVRPQCAANQSRRWLLLANLLPALDCAIA